jgi:hypothetical protein
MAEPHGRRLGRGWCHWQWRAARGNLKGLQLPLRSLELGNIVTRTVMVPGDNLKRRREDPTHKVSRWDGPP